jgi:hypothetical protein
MVSTTMVWTQKLLSSGHITSISHPTTSYIDTTTALYHTINTQFFRFEFEHLAIQPTSSPVL